MALQTTRRSLITGLIAFAAAPAIVRAANLMPVKQMAGPPAWMKQPIIEVPNEVWGDYDIVFKASDLGGPYRWVHLYNDAGPIKTFDLEEEYGHAITLFPGETFTLAFDEAPPVGGKIRLE